MPTPTPELTLRQLAGRDERVFPSYPQVARYFPSAAMEDARKRLARAIDRGDGPGLVIGAPGTGKSLLLQVLAAQYHERFDVVLLAVARLCTRRALLQAVLFELGLPYKMRDEGELRLSLLDHLLSANECPAGLLLLVDEAHTLPVALLDELRVMTNLVCNGVPRVRLVLAGSAALEESFAHPELESFSQRLAARCYLAPLGREETTQYIRAQIAASHGAPDDIFVADAWAAIFEATDGVPRLVNQLCDRALMFGAAENRPRIDREVIQRGWSDLQQLPSPWETPPATPIAAAASQVIEFGGLSDEDSIADVEPTELDFDDAAADVGESVRPPSQVLRAAENRVEDPFAEKFEEEEVVLDNFAAWDDMFPRGMPLVENRRDPGFATLVQAAMDASPVRENTIIASATLGVVRERDVDETHSDQDERDDLNRLAIPDPSAEPDRESVADWPPLRLAIVSDPVPLKPIPLLPPSTRVGAVGAAAFDTMTTVEINESAGKKAAAESPVLLVEEDFVRSRGNPPVRREEYRNLFSRLRSG